MTDAGGPEQISAFKDAMAELVSGVCLLTVRADEPAVDLGMTVTSLASASLDPPMVTVGIGRATSLAPHLMPGALVGITVLAEHQGALAAAFSQKGRPPASELLYGVPHRRAPLTGALVADEALAVLEGRVDQTLAAGDHLLVVIAVLDSAVGAGVEPGLVYQRRGYGRAIR